LFEADGKRAQRRAAQCRRMIDRGRTSRVPVGSSGIVNGSSAPPLAGADRCATGSVLLGRSCDGDTSVCKSSVQTLSAYVPQTYVQTARATVRQRELISGSCCFHASAKRDEEQSDGRAQHHAAWRGVACLGKQTVEHRRRGCDVGSIVGRAK
jgi:hypothetical protein